MKLNFNFTKEHFLNFNMYYFENSDFIRKRILKSRILGPVIFMLLPFVLEKITTPPFLYWFVIFSITSLLWFIFIPKYSKYSYRKSVERLIKEKTDNIFGAKELTLNDDNMTIKGEFQETKTELSSIIDIKESDDVIYLFNSSASAIIIPLQAFENSSQKEEFIRIIKSKVNTASDEKEKKSFFDMLDLK